MYNNINLVITYNKAVSNNKIILIAIKNASYNRKNYFLLQSYIVISYIHLPQKFHLSKSSLGVPAP